MKQIYFFLFGIATLGLHAQTITIPDTTLRNKLLTQNPNESIAIDFQGNRIVDTNNDGQIQLSEALNIKELNISFFNVSDLTGIKEFTNLQTLTLQNTSSVNSVDLSNMTHLKRLSIVNNSITNINLQGTNAIENFSFINGSNLVTNLNFLVAPNLKTLRLVNFRGLTSLNLALYPQLEEFELSSDINSIVSPSFTSVNLSANPLLKKIKIKRKTLTGLTLNPLLQLEEFILEDTKIPSVNLSTSSSLNLINVINNSDLTTFNIQNCNNITTIVATENPQLTALDVSNKPLLTSLSLLNNNITSLDFTGSPTVYNLSLYNNNITTLDTSPITLLSVLSVSEAIETLDVSQNHNLNYLTVHHSTVKYINAKNGNANLSFFTDGTSVPALEYICCDTFNVQDIATHLATQGLNNVQVNSYCNFVPGGPTYNVEGNIRFDVDNNGCSSSDPHVGLQMFSITGYGTTGVAISNQLGTYNLSLSNGSYTITPILENPTYYSVSPTSITANFQTQASPIIQDFCLSANGVYNDLEISLVPLTAAAPGFDAKYKILFKNKGTTTQSGTITLNFNDNVMNFADASIAPSTQNTGVLTWTFSSIQPFETKEITASFILNTPTQTPALNGGDVLVYTAQINAGADETPLDNSFTLNQTVVNSFDPNDKTCLQGTSIAQTQVGDYVHYLIRFENTGTANARNIVVKDIIDTSKFELSSLTALDGSHDFVTRITSPNVVEFIFENIQLPFDDATNDGYVLFKIKTKSSLVSGDTFSNQAEIYFDYNFPIITNNYSTSVSSALDTKETTTSENLQLYPNPVVDYLHFNTKDQVIKVEVYDVAGRIIGSFGVDQNVANLSSIQAGTYLVKVYTKDQIFTEKMIKK